MNTVTTDTAVNALLALSLLVATISVGYALSQPDDHYTDFSVLTRDESGTLVANDYPRTIERGQSAPLVLSITNNERSGLAYTVIVQIQRVQVDDDGTVEDVVESQTLSRDRVHVAPGNRRHFPYDLVPTMVGEDLRISFLLYRGAVPADPSGENAYRTLHLWVTVSPGDGAQTADESR